MLQAGKSTLGRRLVQLLGLCAALFAGLLLGASSASADTRPDPGTPETVTGDVLPTVQHNGVAWDSVAVGNKVFVVGSFTSARPAGSPLGSNEVPRTNMLAFDIRTGELDTSFAPVLDGQILTIAASPDQKTVYIGGDFQKVNGLWRVRVAAFDVATGALKPWAPALGSIVRALDVSDSTVYVGGDFTGAASGAGQALTPRSRAAAFDAVTGQLQDWNPGPDAAPTAITLNYPKTKVIIGGRFQNIAGKARYGLAAIDPVTGADVPWASSSVIRDAGPNAALTSLTSTVNGVYGTGYVYGSGGNFEGTFRADNETGAITWLADCHGDHYSAFEQAGVIYTASHAHYCGNFGGFPQTEPWTMYHSDALTLDAKGTVTKEIYTYANFEGQPAPEQLNWFPTWYTGSATTAAQAAWSVSGNDAYVVYAGEFTGLNGVNQQGLVRFAKRGIAPELLRPNPTDGLTPSLISSTPGQVRVGWQATFDRDNENLTYKVYRNFVSVNDTPVYQTTVKSRFWKRPDVSFVDTTAVPGATYNYRVFAVDPAGNRVSGNAVSITVATAGQEDAYVNTIMADSPNHYYSLDDPAGSTLLKDVAGADNMVRGSGVSFGTAGVHGTATTFSGAAAATYSQVSQLGPNQFSLEAWFKTTSTSGGHIVGYGTHKTSTGSGWQDRAIYINHSGRVSFGVYTDAVKAVTTPGGGYNDGQWHHVVGTVGPQGLRLYLDAKLVASRADATTARYYSGVWRLGGNSVGSGWPSAPTSLWLAGSIDEVAIYGTVLSPSRIAAHYVAGGKTSPLPASPTDAYGKAVFDLGPDIYWRLNESSGSSATDASTSLNTGNVTGGLSWGSAGALSGYTGTAGNFDGSNDLVVASKQVLGGPRAFTAGAWFKTTSTTGGKLIGFGNAASGLSSSYDRHIYLQNDGKVVFGANDGAQRKITSTSAYNDNKWHFAVGTQGPDGMVLYIDGAAVGTDPAKTGQVYDGYWRVGGDNTWGSTSKYLKGQIDEAMVFDRALTAAQVASLYAKGSANQLPTAAFSHEVTGLSVAFDGSGTTDPDGSIASYAWDFGDGGQETGATPTHAYASAGTYHVVLTVTDDRGGVDDVAADVTVAAAPNQPPTSDFSVVKSLLSVTFDGSAAADSDGTITGYAWDYGDGTNDTGKTPAHTYEAAGTYSVTLVVTDDDGATGTVTKDVTVTAVSAADAFERTVASGWGTADVGGAWTTPSSAMFAVSGGSGKATIAASKSPQIYLSATTATDQEVTADISVDRAATGGGTYLSLVGRGASNEGYRGKARIMPDGTVQVSLTKVVAGTETTLASGTSLPAGTFAAGDTLKFRMLVSGTSPTTVRFKVWDSANAEPGSWQVSVTDSTAELQKAGSVGFVPFLSSTATNGPVVISVDNVRVALPGK